MNKIKIFIAGDSTASNYEEARAPQAGWGQVLDNFFTDRVKVVNKAASGRSSKSFYNEGRLFELMQEISAGDYLFVQFGHNDQKDDEDRYTAPFTTYQEYLKRYIIAARERGAFPLLLTPICRRKFDEEGQLINTHGDYPKAVVGLSRELSVDLIDMTSISRSLFQELGEEKTKDIFLWLEVGEHPNYPDGIQDNTHFCTDGAEKLAELIVRDISKQNLPLADFTVLE